MTERVLLGQISRAHGIRGEVIVRSYCAVPDDIAQYGPLSNADGTREFRLTIRGATQKGLIVRIDGVADRTAAEALRNTDLYIARDQLPKPDEDEVYHADMIGLTATDRAGVAIGAVLAVQNFGAGDLLEVQLAGSNRTEFFPFDDAFVPEIDFDAGTLVIAIDESDDADLELGADDRPDATNGPDDTPAA